MKNNFNNMKAILEFNLPEEQLEFELACNGRNYESVLRELSREMRKIVKYDDSISGDYRNAIEDMRTMLRELAGDLNINLD